MNPPFDFTASNSRLEVIDSRMRFQIACGVVCLALLCSCATENPKYLQRPADVTMNKGAGHGDELFVTLQLQDREPLLAMVDTGTSGIVLDQSMEPKLGRCYWIHKMRPWYGVNQLRLHRAPKLFLGDTQLKTSGWVWTGDLSGISHALDHAMHTNRPIMAVLGISCLKHYCIQMDFTANKLRFLDDSDVNKEAKKEAWGQPFRLRPYRGDFSIDENVVGVKGPGSLIDTGCNFDCYLTPKLYNQWTNQMGIDVPIGEAQCPDAVLGGEIYTNVYFHGDGGFNGIGLTLLSRDLVTFDFPDRTMYLKKITTGPLIDHDTDSAMRFVRDLRAKNELPGWSKNDKARIYYYYYSYPVSGILDVGKSGDPTLYHYTLVKKSADGAWKLQKAWQTNEDGKIIKEYSVN